MWLSITVVEYTVDETGIKELNQSLYESLVEY